MSAESRLFAAILLVSIPTIQFGGLTLLRFITARAPGYLDNPVRQNLFRAGHAHAGVLVILALVAMPYVDAATLPFGLKMLVRVAMALAPILIPAGFFFSVASPQARAPGGWIALVYVGGVALAVGTVTLGIGLFL